MTEKEPIIRIDLRSPADFHSLLEEKAIDQIDQSGKKVLLNQWLVGILTEYYADPNRKKFVFRDENSRELLDEDAKRFSIRAPKSLYQQIERHRTHLRRKNLYNVPRNSLILAIIADKLNLSDMIQRYL